MYHCCYSCYYRQSLSSDYCDHYDVDDDDDSCYCYCCFEKSCSSEGMTWRKMIDVVVDVDVEHVVVNDGDDGVMMVNNKMERCIGANCRRVRFVSVVL